MHVFVTGASGHIGSAVVDELLEAGHQVTGLARSDTSAASLTAKGAMVHRGDLADLDGLRAAAAAADGVIHLAYRDDFDSDFIGAAETDLGVVKAMGEVLAGSDRPLVNTSGTLLLAGVAHGRTATENDVAEGGPRIDSENATIAMAERGVRSSVIRLSPLVHSTLDHHGFAHRLIDIAREKGVSAYLGDGQNRWPAIHVLDAAPLYRLALEKGTAGARYHAVAEDGVPLREIAEALGRGLKVPVVSRSPEEAAGHFGTLGFFVGADGPASSALTQERLGWRPTQKAGMIEDLDHMNWSAV